MITFLFALGASLASLILAFCVWVLSQHIADLEADVRELLADLQGWRDLERQARRTAAGYEPQSPVGHLTDPSRFNGQ